jgi:class 3 adenylate cyclase
VIGNSVGIASRLQAMTRDFSHPVLCSQAVAAAVGYGGGLVELATPGADVPRVWGWTPPPLPTQGGQA